jgi:hypothetical protein
MLDFYDFSNQWIGLRGNLQETIDFPIKYGAYTSKFSPKPIHRSKGTCPKAAVKC